MNEPVSIKYKFDEQIAEGPTERRPLALIKIIN